MIQVCNISLEPNEDPMRKTEGNFSHDFKGLFPEFLYFEVWMDSQNCRDRRVSARPACGESHLLRQAPSHLEERCAPLRFEYQAWSSRGCLDEISLTTDVMQSQSIPPPVHNLTQIPRREVPLIVTYYWQFLVIITSKLRSLTQLFKYGRWRVAKNSYINALHWSN